MSRAIWYFIESRQSQRATRRASVAELPLPVTFVKKSFEDCPYFGMVIETFKIDGVQLHKVCILPKTANILNPLIYIL